MSFPLGGLLLAGGLVEAVADSALVNMDPSMLLGPLVFYASPANITFASPIPYGFANNDSDTGWIWPTDNSGMLEVDFGVPTALNKIRIYSCYGGGARGAVLAIEYSADNSTWVLSGEWTYATSVGGGVDDSGNPSSDTSGWYETTFNEAGVTVQYWRIREESLITTPGNTHLPRSGEMEFYAGWPLAVSIDRQGDTILVSWADPLDTAVLQSAETIAGPWLDVPRSFSPHIVSPSAYRKFYRLRR